MSIETTDREFFLPAETIAEAIARIFTLTGAEHRSRGEKRALVALRDALGLDVDVTRTNALLGSRLAGALDIAWDPKLHTEKHKVNLGGLNVLLEGATDAYRSGSLERLQGSVPSTLTGHGWATFQPAVSKIEAVTRIAGLTGAPDEWLGPGSKEHKSVLTNLADRLLPEVDLDRSSKTRLGRDLAYELDVGWTDICYSTGETISLGGLNTILAGAERRLGRVGSTAADVLSTAEAEGAALAAALNDGWKAEPWDARQCVQWMADSRVRGANENEWQGWYFEARGREILNAAFPPRRDPVRTRYGNTQFDYALNHVWDLKAHTEHAVTPTPTRVVDGRGAMLLNDERAMRSCVEEQGLGFLVLSGDAVMDEDGSFVAWHRQFKADRGVKAAPSNRGPSRVRKRTFIPKAVEAFWLPNTSALDAALLAGQLRVRPIGRQPPKRAGLSGAARADKFQLDVNRARLGLCVARREWRYKSIPSVLSS